MKITKYDLQQIRHNALQTFKDKSSQDLGSDEFVVDCYVDSVLGFLKRNGIEVELEKDYYKTHIVKG